MEDCFAAGCRATVASRAASCASPAAAATAAKGTKRSTSTSKRHGDPRPARCPSLCLALQQRDRGPPGTMRNPSFSQRFIRVLNKGEGFSIRVKVGIRGALAASGIPEAAPGNARISNGFAGGASGIQLGSRGPLPTAEELARGRTAEMLILARFYTGFQ